mgnify:CR=1 FL=1
MSGLQIKNGRRFMEVNLLVEDQIRECYARVAWTHKVQEKCADKLLAMNQGLQWTQIILSVVTTSGLIGTICGKNTTSTIIAAIASAILLVVNAYSKNRNLVQLAHQHSLSAVALWHVRETYLSLLVDYKNGAKSDDEVREIRDALQGQLTSVYKEMPRGFSSAYKAASKALKVDEELTLHDAEIDGMLPHSLRRDNVPEG